MPTAITSSTQPLRYYQGSKDYTMQQEYYGVKLNGGVKVTF